jgi:glucose/arabinose dehydrogenase
MRQQLSLKQCLRMVFGLALIGVFAAADAATLLQPVATGLNRPVYLTHAGDAQLYIVEQPGRIVVLTPGQKSLRVFLDIRSRVRSSDNEQGLLSVAFHPDFQRNGRLFVNYTGADGATVVAQYSANADRSAARADSERILLSVAQPYGNHNGGQLQFGADGYLYVGLGDGGAGGDPLNSGQDRTTLLGSMLRLDVNGAKPYAVPPSNPFVNAPGRAEIWATGLRNPWRFSFDRETADLYIADVGQNEYEEINWQPARSRGGENYGWKRMEAGYCYDSWTCSKTGLTRPIVEYGRDQGCSVTGGYVYRGTLGDSWRGRYFYGDYCTGTVWSLKQQNGAVDVRKEVSTRLNISSFGEDFAGELYVLHLGGAVFRLNEQ